MRSVAAGADAQCGRSARARIASIVVGRPELFAEWNDEMGMMAGRIRVGPRLSLSPGHACAAHANASPGASRPLELPQPVWWLPQSHLQCAGAAAACREPQ